MLNFGDEPCSHHYFGQKILFYIDETSQPSLLCETQIRMNTGTSFANQFVRRAQSGPVS